MIIVTGGAGFIGSNIVKGLNDQGRDDILVVDNLTNMVKFKNIQGLKVMDYCDKLDFIEDVKTANGTMRPSKSSSTKAPAPIRWNITVSI